MKTAVTMLGEAFRQWQKDWDSYDKGIGDKPKSYDEFISPFIEKEKEQLKKADINGANRVIYNSTEYGSNKLSLTFEEYYNQTYNQNQ